MNLMQVIDGSVLFGQPPLLDEVKLAIQKNQRVCIVGRNGSGKSTLLKVLNGDIHLDQGRIVREDALRVSMLPQDPPQKTDLSVFDYVAEGLQENAKLIRDFHRVSAEIAENPSQDNLKKLQGLQEKLDASDAWQAEQNITQLITHFSLDANASLASLSGGWRRKAALARAMVQAPDILLLDEPTNHLDIETVKWLEDTLLTLPSSLVFISHDRAFIRKMAEKIIDIDRGKLTEYDCRYDEYLLRKQHDLENEETQNALFDKKLAQEEVWIRQGIKARRTRNEGRVRALKALREEYKSRRSQQGNAVISANVAERSGKRVFEVDNLSYSIEGKQLIDNFSVLINRGDKIGLIGPNGSGKTSLINLLLAKLSPDSGTVTVGTQLQTVYFDQHRQQLPLEKTLIDVVGDGKQDLIVNGKSRHVISYLQDYLFSPERARVPVKALSGGEKNRLLFAKLMLQPNNLLILDEPTNDLDVETLELMESMLVDYHGTLLVVSHDRDFLDNVVTSCLSFEKDAKIRQFVGGYSDVERWYRDNEKRSTSIEKSDKSSTSKVESKTRSSKKLSYNEERALSALPEQIETLEQNIARLQTEVNSPSFFDQSRDTTEKVLADLAALEQELDDAFERWQVLEEKANSLKSQDS